MIKGSVKTEKEYRATIMDSSSSLKEFSLDRKKYYKRYVLGEKVSEEEDSKASVIGRLVETLLFEKDQFDNRFYMSSTAKAPSGNMEIFVESLYRHSSNGESKDFDDAVKAAYKDSGYKLTLEKVLERFIGTDNEIYFKEIKEVRSKGLTVVTTDDVTNAERVVDILKMDENTGPILGLINSDRYTIHTQFQIEGYTIDDLILKSMLDLLIIDHKKKTIQFYDLKCVWNVEGFYEEYYLYRRAYIQAFLYKEACAYLKEQEGLEYYIVEPPKFIVCDSIGYYAPLIYTLDSDDLEDAYQGFAHKGKNYPGVKSIIDSLKWAKENDKWNISKKNYLNNGLTNIKG